MRPVLDIRDTDDSPVPWSPRLGVQRLRNSPDRRPRASGSSAPSPRPVSSSSGGGTGRCKAPRPRPPRSKAVQLGPGAGLSGPKEPPFHFLPADSCPNLESYLTPSSLSPATSHRILPSAPPRNRPPRACPLRRCPRLGDHGAPFGDSHRLLGLAAVRPAAAPARTLLNDYPTRLQ